MPDSQLSPVLLHIGFQKTGSTSVQYWLRDHEALLAEHGVRFPRGWLHPNSHVELSLVLTRLERMTQGRLRGDEWRDPDWRFHVLGQVLVDLAGHRDDLTVLSNEDLSLLRYDDEVVTLRSLIGDARVVMYFRKKEDFVASLAAHYCKPTMAGLSDDPDAFNYVRKGSWLTDYNERIALWCRHFTRVDVLSYDGETARDGSVVPSFLRLLGVPVTPDAITYRLQRRGDPVVRGPGNRSFGLLFGQPLPSDMAGSHLGGKLSGTSMPAAN